MPGSEVLAAVSALERAGMRDRRLAEHGLAQDFKGWQVRALLGASAVIVERSDPFASFLRGVSEPLLGRGPALQIRLTVASALGALTLLHRVPHPYRVSPVSRGG